jgi:hypothetical protein
VAVSEYMIINRDIIILSSFILFYNKDRGYYVAVRECTLSVWEINIITGFYFNLCKESGYYLSVS